MADRKANGEGPALESWEAVEVEMSRCMAASSEPFDPATLHNASVLINRCRNRKQIPVGIAKGYWSTICVSWDGVEIEVFDDRYELYEIPDGATAIEYFDVSLGEHVLEKLIARLPCLKIES